MITLLADSSKWDEAADNSYYSSVSYKYGWLQSIGACFPYLKPLPLAEISQEGIIEYICPCFIDKKNDEIVSSIFLAAGFINKNTNPNETVQKLIEYAIMEKCKKILLQIPPGFYYSDNLISEGFTLQRKVPFFELSINKLDSFENYIETVLPKRKNRYIKAAYKKGVEIEMHRPSEKVVDRFYRFYNELGNRKKIQIFEKSFITRLSESLDEHAWYWIATINGQDCGAILSFEFKNRLWLWLISSSREFNEYRVDDLLYVRNIQYGFDKKLEIIDFGTSPLESSLGDYKKQFGCKPVFHEIYILDLSISRIVKRIYIDLKRIIKKTKVP